jgi:hypothetical protein
MNGRGVVALLGAAVSVALRALGSLWVTNFDQDTVWRVDVSG